jgi:hypothetical protein
MGSRLTLLCLLLLLILVAMFALLFLFAPPAEPAGLELTGGGSCRFVNSWPKVGTLPRWPPSPGR